MQNTDAMAVRSITGKLLTVLMAVLMVAAMMPLSTYAAEQDADEFVVSGIEEEYVYTGSEIKPAPVVSVGDKVLEEGPDYELVYESKKDDFTSGGAKVLLTVLGNGEYESKSPVTVEYRIVKAKIDKMDVTWPEGVGKLEDGTVQYEFTGEPIKPEPVITVDGRVLEKGKDYLVVYLEKRDLVNVGGKKLTATISGIGNYKIGVIMLSYTIVPKKITPDVTLSEKSFKFNGSVQQPEVTVKDGEKVLAAGTDYTVSFSGSCKNVGKYNAKVTLQGQYEGEGSAAFKINPKNTGSFKVKAGKKSLKVTWKKQSAKMSSSRITGYQIQYSRKADFGSGSKKSTVKGYKTVSKTIKNLKKGKRYYVRIRTYKIVNGNKYYSSWSIPKSVKVK